MIIRVISVRREDMRGTMGTGLMDCIVDSYPGVERR